MSASKVYFTDMRCPVGTGLLDKLKKLGVKYYNLESYCDEKSIYYGKCSLSRFLALSYGTITGLLTDSDRVFSLRG